jgi:hypothetical protein
LYIRAAEEFENGSGTNRSDVSSGLGLGIRFGKPPIGDVHGGLGDAVHVHELGTAVAVAPEPRTKLGKAQRLAAEDHMPQCKRLDEAGLFDLDELVERGRRLVQDGHPLVSKQVVEILRRTGHPIGNDDEPSSGQQTAPDFPYGEIERGGMEHGPDVLGPKAEPIVR